MHLCLLTNLETWAFIQHTFAVVAFPSSPQSKGLLKLQELSPPSLIPFQQKLQKKKKRKKGEGVYLKQKKGMKQQGDEKEKGKKREVAFLRGEADGL